MTEEKLSRGQVFRAGIQIAEHRGPLGRRFPRDVIAFGDFSPVRATEDSDALAKAESVDAVSRSVDPAGAVRDLGEGSFPFRN